MQQQLTTETKPTYAELEAKVLKLETELSCLRRFIYGQKRERFVPAQQEDQLTFLITQEKERQVETEQISYVRTKPGKKRKHPGRLSLPESLPRKEIIIALNEIFRVLRKGGLAYINLLSVEDYGFGKGTEHEKGEFSGDYHGKEMHTYLEDQEADDLFNNWKILFKQKRTAKTWVHERYMPDVNLDYILKKI